MTKKDIIKAIKLSKVEIREWTKFLKLCQKKLKSKN